MPRGGKPAASSKPNPFDSDSDSESQPARKPSGAYQAPADAKKRYKDGFRDAGGLENQSVQELEHYAAYKAEETTDALAGCLRIAEDIKKDASDTLITLHKQGEQISRTHEKAVEIDQDLTKSESLLGSLGGFFSKPWKPKKTRQIKGPAMVSRGNDPALTVPNKIVNACVDSHCSWQLIGNGMMDQMTPSRRRRVAWSRGTSWG
jgi:synaptosomal-associated protein 25